MLNYYSDRKLIKSPQKEEQTSKKEIEEDFMCFPLNNNNMNTDVPNLDKKIKRNIIVKLVP